jgi:hypothetical protein
VHLVAGERSRNLGWFILLESCFDFVIIAYSCQCMLASNDFSSMFCLDDVPVSVKNGHLRFRDVCQGI